MSGIEQMHHLFGWASRSGARDSAYAAEMADAAEVAEVTLNSR